MTSTKTALIFLATTLSLSIHLYAQVNRANNKMSQQQVQNSRQVSSINNTVSYQGMISIPPDVYSKMLQQTHTSVNSIPGNPVKVQLWKVAYQPDVKKNGFTKILLQQAIPVSDFSSQVVAGGVSYKFDAQPTGNLAIVVFSNKLNAVPGLVLKGRPDDGSAQGSLHHYESDAKKDLGENIVYGVYSITAGKTDMNHLDFAFSASVSSGKSTMDFDIGGFVSDAADDIGQVAKKIYNGISYVFDQTIDGVSGLAKLVINGAVDVAGFFIDQAGLIYYEIGGTLVNLIAYGNLPKERSLRQEEYDWANKMVFNGNLPDINMIRVFNFMSPLSSDPTSFQNAHRYYTWPSPDGKHIFMNLGDAFDNPMGATLPNYPGTGQVLIHELSHAWQIKKYGFTGMIQKYFSAPGGLSQAYDPGCSHNAINSNFTVEQEATIVDRTFLQIYYHQTDSYSCTAFEQQWTENNVRNGVKFDVAKINATNAMQQYARSLSSFIGNVNNAEAVYTTGTSKDGDGYYMLGSIPWSVVYYRNKDKKVYANWGEIRKKYNDIKAEHSFLGWPQRDIGSLRNGGSYQLFDHGTIYSTPQFGTFIVDGFILEAWGNQKWEAGPLGYPISDFIPDNPAGSNADKSRFNETTPGGQQKFEHGIIRWGGRPGMQAEVILNSSIINKQKEKVLH